MFYQDIVEERSGNGVCGYLACCDPPSNERQQYRISMNFNKVFEIEERKKFCSDVCFRRSMFLLGQIDSGPIWLREGRQKEFEFLTDSIGLPGKEIHFEVIAEMEDDDDDGIEQDTPTVLNQAAQDLKLYLERTSKDNKEEEGDKDEIDSDDEKPIEKKASKEKVEEFDMREVMLKFLNEMMGYLLTRRSAGYLNLAPEFTPELDSDDDLPPDAAKFVPKSEKREKIVERNAIPSFENLTTDMQRIRISEFFNPQADYEPTVGGTTVNVRQEQEKILTRKIEQKIKLLVSTLGINKDHTMDDIKDFIKEIEVDSKMVCLRQSEALLVTVTILILLANVSTEIMTAVAKNSHYLNDLLAEFKLTIDDIKVQIRTACEQI